MSLPRAHIDPEALYTQRSDIADDEEQKEQPTQEEMDDFRAQVNEFIRIDDQVKKLMVAVRERRTQQRALSNAIQTFMIRYGYDNLSTQHGRITSSVRSVKLPVKQADIRTKLVQLKGDDEGNALIRKIFEDDRPMIEKKSLRRIIPKVNTHLQL